ncbi:peptidase T [Gallibacterium salpingitidis]|uniref:Peptidase T n=1 Tax=Gallibacterium salpingitidis TaxID=505341 RepID=A0A1A7NS29_9PAST|nr:peptidase T [Gallibacterium salpingitidis]OBW92321.1 peptidase T [Gallibacterium salpingitidis]
MYSEETLKNGLLDRFLNYVSFDTQSKEGVKHSPSSRGQWLLAEYLRDELKGLGLAQVEMNSHGVVTALLPSNIPNNQTTIGLIAHLDTYPGVKGKDVKPEVISEYRGGDIALGLGEEFISPVTSPFLQKLVGHTLIVTDGTTLLGADNKAGIAEIMTALATIISHRLPRVNIRVAFTPDEEIGAGMQFFPLEQFACDWAYTIDGSGLGEVEYENFNAATATIAIKGQSIHLGYAKDKLVNALALACDLHQLLPREEVPEKTTDRQGFFHLDSLTGDIEYCEMKYLIRDFSDEGFAQRKTFLCNLVEQFAKQHKLADRIDITIQDSYHNMFNAVAKVPQSIKVAELAMEKCGISAKHKIIRGGTDGAWLSENGIACPNLFTGAYNFHSKHELASLDEMQQATKVIIEIAQLAQR